jgi:protease-4
MAYANSYTQKEYYLNPLLVYLYKPCWWYGFQRVICWAYVFKDLQEKPSKMEVIRHGKYKSAVEPFLENEMSDANREQVTVLLNSLEFSYCWHFEK